MEENYILKHEKLYERKNTTYDVLGKRYVMEMLENKLYYYSRKKRDCYGVGYRPIIAFISLDTPFLQDYLTSDKNEVIKELNKIWDSVLDYVLYNRNPEWVQLSTGSTNYTDTYDQESLCNFLKITSKEFDLLRKFSPYSEK